MNNINKIPEETPIAPNETSVDSKQNFFKLVVTLSLFILLFVISATLAYFSYLQNRYKSIRSIPKQENTRLENDVDDYSSIFNHEILPNLTTYTNKDYGFEVKYFPESPPTENVGNEQVGQFTYLLLIKFGTYPLKSRYGFSIEINKQKSLDDYQLELIGHITDKINSEVDVSFNGNNWTKLNYEIFLTTDYVPITTAFINHGEYGYAIISSSQEIDQILSTFRFIDQ